MDQQLKSKRAGMLLSGWNGRFADTRWVWLLIAFSLGFLQAGRADSISASLDRDTLPLGADIADSFVPKALQTLAAHGVTVHGDSQVAAYGDVIPAEDKDFAEEYLSLDLAIAIVESLDSALHHIRRYSTGHSETIVTESQTSAARFSAEVDAAAVLVNASSRFVDGGEFGFGAEIGISTQKLHARGPMGLPEMTSTKYVVTGSGQVRH